MTPVSFHFMTIIYAGTSNLTMKTKYSLIIWTQCINLKLKK